VWRLLPQSAYAPDMQKELNEAVEIANQKRKKGKKPRTKYSPLQVSLQREPTV
jgi:hypothetical protein